MGIIIIIALQKKNENLRILNFVKVSKSEIRENLNTRKLPDLRYTFSAAQGLTTACLLVILNVSEHRNQDAETFPPAYLLHQ